jgi:hypothetical protein
MTKKHLHTLADQEDREKCRTGVTPPSLAKNDPEIFRPSEQGARSAARSPRFALPP